MTPAAPPWRRHHWSRSATMGSTADACHVGSHVAMRATVASKNDTAANVCGSIGETSISKLPTIGVTPRAPRRPIARPTMESTPTFRTAGPTTCARRAPSATRIPI